jgi:hypothetical protein
MNDPAMDQMAVIQNLTGSLSDSSRESLIQLFNDTLPGDQVVADPPACYTWF